MKDCIKRIKQLLKDKGWKQGDLAAATGISDSSLSQYLNGRIGMSFETIDAIAHVFNVEPSWVIYGVGKKNRDALEITEKAGYIVIPVLTWDQAVTYKTEDKQRYMDDSMIEKISVTSSKFSNSFALKVQGNSMIGGMRHNFYEDDIIVIHPDLKPKNSDFVIVKPQGYDVPILRQFYREGGRVYYSPLNKGYDKIEASNETDIIGVVVHKIESLREI